MVNAPIKLAVLLSTKFSSEERGGYDNLPRPKAGSCNLEFEYSSNRQPCSCLNSILREIGRRFHPIKLLSRHEMRVEREGGGDECGYINITVKRRRGSNAARGTKWKLTETRFPLGGLFYLLGELFPPGSTTSSSPFPQ